MFNTASSNVGAASRSELEDAEDTANTQKDLGRGRWCFLKCCAGIATVIVSHVDGHVFGKFGYFALF